ncbi:MAG TPA: hypothetical protein VGS19_04160 [Streptosporangiaceae bacterium]|nr:hypothetical protein [Streptosporangiaceae bacterium]
MTTESAYAGDDPRGLLSDARELAQGVRRAQRATWFPLLVFAAITFVAIPVLGFSSPHLGSCVFVYPAGRAVAPVGRACAVDYTAGLVYWPIAAVLAYVAIAAFYIRQSRARGVGTRVRPYAIVGIILALVVTGASLWAFHHPSARGVLLPPGLSNLGNPASAIGYALLVLAWAERNRALLLVALGYTVVVLTRFTFGWVIHTPGFVVLPNLVVDGSVLLLAGIGFALAQRPWRSAE